MSGVAGPRAQVLFLVVRPAQQCIFGRYADIPLYAPGGGVKETLVVVRDGEGGGEREGVANV